ncbi:ABC transporter permease [Jatrophihabitans telluris]|uniref:ABC transporter permease n=1 Tax=Jatrophihabitans telluris TaxID=2038343 RepID=A0ABY4QX63_9ACTN|nr:ABC transporter permease [Jatrophihabitans telluris]UQX87717.1 ABC transporter permease [Jatrophihabitans telluris]
MIRYIIRRLLASVLVVWVISLVTFVIFQITPKILHQSLAYYYVGKIPPNPEGLAAVNHRFGFDLPWYRQYFNYVGGIFSGRTIDDGSGTVLHCNAPCLGYSFRQNLPVTRLLSDAIPVSASLAIGAGILWLVGGVTVGAISALKRGSLVDRVSMGIALGAVSLPIFFTGPILLLIFSYKLAWLKDMHYVNFTDNPLEWAKNLILPWVALAFLFAALYARLTRANMLETMSEDYIRTARAKGLSRRAVVIKHGLRAALTPIVTIFGIDIGTLIGTTVITETVFNLHGLGKLSVDAIRSQDLPIVLGVTIVASIAVVLSNLVVDVVYAVVDPRVSYS